MAKPHKYEKSHIVVASSTLKAEKLLSLAKEVADNFKQIRVEGESDNTVHLVVKSIARMNILDFTVTARDKDSGSEARTEIGQYVTNQSTIFIFIPIGPKEMNGYRPYKKYMELYGKAVQVVDPKARVTITEREGM